MKILVVGGTGFIGSHLTKLAAESGHDVTSVHRHRSAELPRQPTSIKHIVADRDHGLLSFRRENWDAVFDCCAYRPSQVASLAHELGDSIGHYVHYSSVAAYANPAKMKYLEDSPLQLLPARCNSALTNEPTYGLLKAQCEVEAARHFAGRIMIIRPTYVVGDGEKVGILRNWVMRLRAGGLITLSEPPCPLVQLIDIDDLTAWSMAAVTDRRTTGVFHVASPEPPFRFRELIECIRETVAPVGTECLWVSPANSSDAQLGKWPGSSDPDSLINAADASAARSAGLTTRPLASTIESYVTPNRQV